MTEVLKTKPRYQLRLTARYAFYDAERSHLFWDWAAGSIVTDPSAIAILEAHGAPVERIEELSPPPIPQV